MKFALKFAISKYRYNSRKSDNHKFGPHKKNLAAAQVDVTPARLWGWGSADLIDTSHLREDHQLNLLQDGQKDGTLMGYTVTITIGFKQLDVPHSMGIVAPIVDLMLRCLFPVSVGHSIFGCKKRLTSTLISESSIFVWAFL